MGPRNITRVVGEEYVPIPCPFSGQYTIIWEINGIPYEHTTLPSTYELGKGVLIIKNIRLSMNNSTFRCLYPTGHHYTVKASDIGTLLVLGDE